MDGRVKQSGWSVEEALTRKVFGKRELKKYKNE